jgi:hypothetical protein
MSKKNYPRHIAPSDEFLSRLEREKDPSIEVSDMMFCERAKNAFGGSFFVRMNGKRWRQEVIISKPLPCLEAIEDYVLNALKPGGQLA